MLMLRRRCILPLSLLLLAACQSWQRRDLDPTGTGPALSGNRPVRVTRTDQSVLVLTEPRVVGDSIVGQAGDPPRRAAVALADVQRVEERRTSAGRTTGAVLGGSALVLSILIVIAAITLVAW